MKFQWNETKLVSSLKNTQLFWTILMPWIQSPFYVRSNLAPSIFGLNWLSTALRMATTNTLNKMRMLLQHSKLVNRTEHKETRPKKWAHFPPKNIRPIVEPISSPSPSPSRLLIRFGHKFVANWAWTRMKFMCNMHRFCQLYITTATHVIWR